MTTANTAKSRRDTLNLRISAHELGLIDRAAASTGRTRTAFILEAARRAAEEALLDHALLVVSPAAHKDFLKRLDRPARPNAKLKHTMRNKVPWRAD